MSERGRERHRRIFREVIPIALILFDILLVIMTSVDLFGRMLNESKAVKGPPGDGFKRTSSGHFNIEGKMLRNVRSPEEAQDVVNLVTLYSMMNKLTSDFDSKLEKHISSVRELRGIVNQDFADLKQTIKKFHEESQTKIDLLYKYANDLRRLIPQDG